VSWLIGEIRVVPVFEVDAGDVIDGILPAAAVPLRWTAAWLRPSYVEPDGRSKAVVQAFAIEIDGLRIVVDPGVGDGKTRPEIPDWSGLDSGFIERLSAAGFAPDSVDVVALTHLHLDHVGWLTTKGPDGGWQPTFPGARHLVEGRELDYWLDRPVGPSPDALAAIDDSVRPVVDAGLSECFSSTVRVAPGVSLVPTHGHTPGHSSVLIESVGASALISGDAFHHPIQIEHPEFGSASDFDPEAAHQTRISILERCAANGTLLIGSHFASPSAGHVIRAERGFRWEPTRAPG
jgi:glyoxylase-like metal-dependent hydrolase (beta-lactamase superfamily II)